MIDRNRVIFKGKKCPLHNFDICIGRECAFYDELSTMEEAHVPPDDFTFCSLSYLPIIYHELKEFLDDFGNFRENLKK